jgi:hypothetical protein
MLRRAISPLEIDERSGDVETDLQHAMTVLIEGFRRRPVRAFLSSLIEWSRHSEDASAATEEFVRGMLRPFEAAIGAAVETGAMEGDVPDLVAELTGPILMRYMLLGEVPDDDDGERAVTKFLTVNSPTGAS